jgi:hypothetical protein
MYCLDVQLMDLCHICFLHMEDQMSQLMFQHFLKKRNRMSGKTVANSCHCLDTTFIQDIDFQNLAGSQGTLCCIHSSSYMFHHLRKPIQIWCWCILPTHCESILIIVRSKVFNGKGWPSWSLTSKFLILKNNL